MQVSVDDYLKRLGRRIDLLPETEQRDQVAAIYRTAVEHWSQYDRQRRHFTLAGLACFVGEIEHIARLDELARTGIRHRQASARGGTGKAPPEWQARCVSHAEHMIANGRDPREVAGILAVQYGRDSGTVRRVLRKAGIK